MDVAAFPFRSHQFYFEFFIDDMTTAENLFTYFGNKFAFLTGWRWISPFGLSDADVQIEYARIEPYVYTHEDAINVYSNYNTPLGHWLGPNAEDLFLKVNYWTSRDLKLAMLIERIRRGEGDLDSPHTESHGTRKQFLSGVVETTWSLGIEARYQIMRDVFLTFSYHYLDINNLNHIDHDYSNDHQIKFYLTANY